MPKKSKPNLKKLTKTFKKAKSTVHKKAKKAVKVVRGSAKVSKGAVQDFFKSSYENAKKFSETAVVATKKIIFSPQFESLLDMLIHYKSASVEAKPPVDSRDEQEARLKRKLIQVFKLYREEEIILVVGEMIPQARRLVPILIAAWEIYFVSKKQKTEQESV